jgi:D-alanine-D-alanine ligase
VLGNEDARASAVGEVLLQRDFYSYEAKYLDENGAVIKIPADLPDNVVKDVQELSIKVFKVLECEGMTRVDVFLTPENRIVVNEVNTIPGFTSISMYPKLWEESGIAYTDLITKLIDLAIERYERDKKLKTTRG